MSSPCPLLLAVVVVARHVDDKDVFCVKIADFSIMLGEKSASMIFNWHLNRPLAANKWRTAGATFSSKSLDKNKVAWLDQKNFPLVKIFYLLKMLKIIYKTHVYRDISPKNPSVTQ